MAGVALAATSALSAATSVGTGLSALAGAGGASTLFQGGASVASMIASLGRGSQASEDGAAQLIFSNFAADIERGEAALAAGNEDLQATQEFIIGESRAASIREELNRVLGQHVVSFAAAGVDPTSGTAARIAEANEAKAERNIRVERTNARIRQLQARGRARTLRRRGELTEFERRASGLAALRSGQSAGTAGVIEAIGTGFDFAADVAKRG